MRSRQFIIVVSECVNGIKVDFYKYNIKELIERKKKT